MFITEDMLSKVYEFSHACRGFGSAKLEFLIPEVKDFYLRNMADQYKRGNCPACGKNDEFFYLVVKKFLSKIGIEISRIGKGWDYSSEEVEIDKCSFGNVHFLDGLCRMARGDNLDETISNISGLIRKERDKLVPEIREELQKDITLVNMELERRIDLLRNSAADAILVATKKLEEYANLLNPRNAVIEKHRIEISVAWPEKF